MTPLSRDATFNAVTARVASARWSSQPKAHALLGVLLVALIGLAVSRVHVRVQTTLLGYQLGQLKDTESRLLEEQSRLKMQLAKLTARKHLQLMAESGDDDLGAPAEATLAARR